MNDLIHKKMDVRRVGPPPILCWMGTGRHRLHHGDVGRKLLAELFADLGYKTGAEIGVDRGTYSKVMLDAKPNLTLYLIDSWEGRRSRQHCVEAHKTLQPYGVRADFRRFKSLDAAKQFEPNSLDFVYIDCVRDFNSVTMDLIEWGRRVRPGGMISGRGYCHMFDTGVVKAVDAYTYAHYVRDWYITREVEPQFFFIKHWKSQ